MKDKKLQLGLLIGATVLVVVVIMICVFTGSLDVGGSSVPAPENQVVIEEISESEIKGYYLTESGRKKQVNIPVADTVVVEDVKLVDPLPCTDNLMNVIAGRLPKPAK